MIEKNNPDLDVEALLLLVRKGMKKTGKRTGKKATNSEAFTPEHNFFFLGNTAIRDLERWSDLRQSHFSHHHHGFLGNLYRGWINRIVRILSSDLTQTQMNMNKQIIIVFKELITIVEQQSEQIEELKKQIKARK